jgi:methyl-accepting chemotaxis protein
MSPSIKKRKSVAYAVAGVVLAAGAPIGWTILRLIFFPDTGIPLSQQIFSDFTKSPYNVALYLFMGVGTAVVMSLLGFYIGKATDELHERASELDGLHREVASQKEVFENRYKVLDNNIKNFHQISSRIQRSINVNEVLKLCAEGLNEILGYERVNILMVDEGKRNLRFVSSTGTPGFEPEGVTLPLDHRSGVIYKCFAEKRLFLIEDMANHPADYALQPPYNAIKPLRSRSFVICPIVVKGETVGVFGIDNKLSHRSLNDTDVDTIKLFADQAASAIIKINLLTAINRLTAELEKTFAGLLSNREQYSSTLITLERSVDSVAEGTARIVSASDRVMGAVDETSSAVGQISVAIDGVSHNIDYLAENVDKSVSAMEEINDSIKSVEENAVVSHRVSSEVKTQSERGRGVVRETIAALAEIQTSVELSYEGIRRLSENSGRIDSIVGVINDITRRTNLLALNASIIAAQAGEYGKSFGVVADEIRNLSLQTGRSTGEITGIITEILDESKEAAQNVTFTKDLVQKGVELGQAASDALESINGSSGKSMDMTHEIMTATREQSKSVQFVTRSIEDISTMTSQISNASKEQNISVKSIVQAINSIKDLSQEMVKSTAKQAEGGTEIRRSLESVTDMIRQIYDDMEKRHLDSNEVVGELEMLKRTSN